jgi:aspartyl protease family protein
MEEPSPPKAHRKTGIIMLVFGWIIILILLGSVFTDMLERQENPNQNVTGRRSDSYNEVTLVRNKQHHYVANGMINGQPVTFLVDTGATHVAIPPNVAQRLNLAPGRAGVAQTANGSVRTASTTLNSLNLGTITLENVRASITYGMMGEEILLGMSALKNVEFTHRNGVLTIKQPLALPYP